MCTRGLIPRNSNKSGSLETNCHIVRRADSMVGNHRGEEGWIQTSRGAKATGQRNISEREREKGTLGSSPVFRA